MGVRLEPGYAGGEVAEPLIQVEGLRKTYRQGFWMRRVEAVRGVSFRVTQGESFGFLGPNGAGKTTTIKILMGLMRPTGGHVRLFGFPVPERRSREKVGFMPENPYVYPYLTPREFVGTCARLSGLRGAVLRDRVEHVLRQTGIAYAASPGETAFEGHAPAHRAGRGAGRGSRVAGARRTDERARPRRPQGSARHD